MEKENRFKLYFYLTISCSINLNIAIHSFLHKKTLFSGCHPRHWVFRPKRKWWVREPGYMNLCIMKVKGLLFKTCLKYHLQTSWNTIVVLNNYYMSSTRLNFENAYRLNKSIMRGHRWKEISDFFSFISIDTMLLI